MDCNKAERGRQSCLECQVYYAGKRHADILRAALFYYTFDKSMKVGASVVVARRGGLFSTYDELNKFFGISEYASHRPILEQRTWTRTGRSGRYQACRVCALLRNMSFLMKVSSLARKNGRNPRKGRLLHELHSIMQEVVAGKDRVCTRSCVKLSLHSLWFRAVWAFS